MLEVRVDQFRKFDLPYVLKQFQKFKRAGLPLLGTVRSPKEGGNPVLSDAQRKTLFLEIIPYLDWVDIELSSKSLLSLVVSESRKNKTGVVFSFHDFKKTPSLSFLEKLLEQRRRYNKAADAHADLLKIAVHAKNKEDVQRLFTFTLKNHSTGLITISMGQVGMLSRIFFALAGSQWTYTFLSKASAPGQISLKELSPLIQKFYREEPGKL